jgi:hypothetical protein
MAEEIASLLESGPKVAKELINSLTVSKVTFYKKINELVEEGKVLEFPLKAKNGWISLYALPKHRELAASISGFSQAGKARGDPQEIRRVIENLRVKLLRNPTVDEVILAMGKNPRDDELMDAVYEIGTKMGWRPPTESEKEAAEEELPKILSLAAQIKRGTSMVKMKKVKSRSEIEKAKEYLRRFPELVPEI